MTKPISSYWKPERQAVINRRLAGLDRGMGYLSAKDAVDLNLIEKREREKAAQKAAKEAAV